MQQSSISAIFGALSNEMRLNIIANNLANANTVGYKADKVSFQDVFQRLATDYAPDPRDALHLKKRLPSAVIVAKPRLAEQTVDLSQGALEHTENPFDLAISGPGFFRVQTPNGPMLTRNGQFYRNVDGQLVTNQGFALMGQSGAVSVPEGRNVAIMPDGSVMVDNQPVSSVDLVKVADPKTLQKVGSSLFTGANGALPATQATNTSETMIYQGYLEKPNVNVVTEMVGMIEAHRSFEAYTKIITSTQDMDEKASRVGESR
ncbi:flagellar basal-body rod protein FlgF [Fundidesulfovibrio butyratiphilus]